MPELPEVETVVRDLRPILIGQRFLKISTVHAPILQPSLEAFAVLKGAEVETVGRRGKFINIFFDNAQVMTIHLRMTGRLIAAGFDDPELGYERTRIDFGDVTVRFCDLRKFGKVWVNRVDEYESATGIINLGVEPFGADFDFQMFRQLFSGRRGAVKKWLLDQRLVAGVGNIYADEACFYAGIRPDAETSELSGEELERLFDAVLRALEQGIRNRGTSVKDYADAYGKSGKNQEMLYVYSRGGKPCLKCETDLIKTKVAGRGTVYCPECQV
jgi:formamidopyrimidine-DNA glycosylase